MGGKADRSFDRVTSADEAVSLLKSHHPVAVTLFANSSGLDERATPTTEGPAVTIVLDRLLFAVPPVDRRSAWTDAVQRILGHLDRLISLTIDGVGLSAELIVSVVERSPELRIVGFSDCGVDDASAEAIAAQLPKLTMLNLRHNWVGDAGAEAIAERLPGLTVFDLEFNRVSDAGAEAIAERLPSLIDLNLGYNDVGDAGAEAIAEHLHRLTTLDLRSNRVGESGVRAIAERLPDLTMLDLGYNDVGDAGAEAIAEHLHRLTTLDLRNGQVRELGARAIAGQLVNLTTLDLGDNGASEHDGVGDAGAEAIAEHLHRLTSLDLANNRVGDAGVAVIAERLHGLTTLHLANNRVGESGVRAIAKYLSNVIDLDLGYNEAGDEGARALAEHLPNLTALNLAGNGISDAGVRMVAEHLPNLTTLYLGHNEVGELGARAIAEHLSNLTTLHVIDNRVGDAGVRVLAEHLPNLTTLYLGYNEVGESGARAIAENLPNLEHLFLGDNHLGYLGRNQVGDVGARVIAEYLPNLTTLDLEDNRVGETGIRVVLDMLAGDVARRLRYLYLSSNEGVSALGLGELAQQHDAAAIVAAYRRLTHADNADKVAFGEAKLVVLGDEAVGKTSLIRALVERKTADPDESRTSGVNHRIWVTEWAPADEGRTQLNIWDFGGQEIMHQTHRYFLTERCIHLIVLDRRRQDDTSVHRWLQTVAHRAPKSPVVIVINKCDDGTHNLDVDFPRLRLDHPEIEGIFTVSCAPETDSLETTMVALRDCLRRLVTEDERLNSVRVQVPKAWVRVRDAVRIQASEAHVLTAQQYVNLCQAGDDPALRVTNPDEQSALLRLLHQIGAVVAHGLTPTSDTLTEGLIPTTDTLTGLTLLDPNWFTDAVYALLDYGTHEFDRHDLGARLRKDADRTALYPDDRLDYIIDLLQQPEFALAFRLPGDANPPRYLLPEALPSTAPTSISGWDGNSLRFRFRYERLPRGLIPQFQVLSHQHAGRHPERWRAGCTVTVHGCPVLIDGNPASNRVDILVAGPEHQRRDALAVVRDLFQRVHERMPEAVPTARVPLPDNANVDTGYAYLRDLEARFGPSHTFLPENADHEYTVGALLSGVRSTHEPPPSESQPVSAGGGVTIVNTIEPPQPQPPTDTDDALSRRADAASVVGALAGVPLGAIAVAIYLLGRGDDWPFDMLVTGATTGGMVGAIAGALILGRRTR